MLLNFDTICHKNFLEFHNLFEKMSIEENYFIAIMSIKVKESFLSLKRKLIFITLV